MPTAKENLGPAKQRHGFTLLEIMLAVVVMVIMVAITAPMALQSIQTGKLIGSADKVQAAFADARTRAIRSGNQYAFYFSNTGRGFFVTKFDALNPTQLPAWLTEDDEDASLAPEARRNFLEIGVQFSSQDISQDSRSQESGQSDVSGFQRILFYPDGQVQPARVYLTNEMNDRLVVELRSLTGSSRVYEVDQQGNELE